MKDPHLKFQPQSIFKFAVNAVWLSMKVLIFRKLKSKWWCANESSQVKIRVVFFQSVKSCWFEIYWAKISLEAWYFVLNEIDTKLVITNLLLSDIYVVYFTDSSHFSSFQFVLYLLMSLVVPKMCDYLCIRFVYCASHSSHKMFSVMFFFFSFSSFFISKYLKHGTWTDHHSIARNSWICSIRWCRWYTLCITLIWLDFLEEKEQV